MMIPRFDLRAFADRRAALILLITFVSLLAPIGCYLFREDIEALNTLPKIRLLARLASLFLFFGAMNVAAILTRIGVARISARQYQLFFRLHFIPLAGWAVLLTIDFVFVLALPRTLSIGSLRLDLGPTVLYWAFMAVLFHSQDWFYGFQLSVLQEASKMHEQLDVDSNLGELQPIDTLDYQVLQLVSKTGGDPLSVMINDTGLSYDEMMLRLRKLCLLGYLRVHTEHHGANMALTVVGTDAMALPVALFVWDTDDREMLKDLALARTALEQRQPQKVVVLCARISERILRDRLQRHDPSLTMIGHKKLGSATLGELVGACRQHELIGKFDDYVLSAINERRKKIHDLQDESAIDENDALFLFVLTEIAARNLAAK